MRLKDLNYAESVKIQLPNGLALRYAWIPKILLDSDFDQPLRLESSREYRCHVMFEELEG